MTFYLVRRGDSLSRIARRELGDGNRWPEIAELNGLADPDLIAVGQKLRLPAGAASAAVGPARPEPVRRANEPAPPPEAPPRGSAGRGSARPRPVLGPALKYEFEDLFKDQPEVSRRVGCHTVKVRLTGSAEIRDLRPMAVVTFTEEGLAAEYKPSLDLGFKRLAAVAEVKVGRDGVPEVSLGFSAAALLGGQEWFTEKVSPIASPPGVRYEYKPRKISGVWERLEVSGEVALRVDVHPIPGCRVTPAPELVPVPVRSRRPVPRPDPAWGYALLGVVVVVGAAAVVVSGGTATPLAYGAAAAAFGVTVLPKAISPEAGRRGREI